MPRRRLTVTSLAWQELAACTGRSELFFGPSRERPEQRQRRVTAAKALCATCPVLAPCRRTARLDRESGLWGGETEEERAAAGYAPRAITRRAVQRAADSAQRRAS